MTQSKYVGEPSRAKLVDLAPFPGNSRIHDARQLEFLKKELLEVGQTRPLLVNRTPVKGVTNPIIAGNGLYEAMLALGWHTCDVLYFNFHEQQAASLNVRDNRAYELGNIDKESLIIQLYELQNDGGFSLDELGYDNDEFDALEKEARAQAAETEKLLGEIDNGGAPSEFENIGKTVSTDTECPKCGYKWS